MYLFRRQTCTALPNTMTEFTPVVEVVAFYWLDLLNELSFSPLVRLLSHAVWVKGVFHSA